MDRSDRSGHDIQRGIAEPQTGEETGPGRPATGHAGSEAWPSWDPAAGPQPDSREDTPVRQEVQPAVAPGATPTMAPSAGFEDAAPAAGSGHTAPLSGRSDVQKGRMTATEHPHAAYDDAQEDATAEITEDFDLRRAVIYSEILKPKFDE